MKKTLVSLVMVGTSAFLLSGCGPSPEAQVKKLYRPSPDKDVTTEPQYNFSSFAGTVWKTKTKLAMADVKRYTGAHDIKLLAPDCFDPAAPRYNPPANMQIIAVLPPDTRLRIARLLQDQGAAGGFQVQAVLLDGTNADKTVLLDPILLTNVWWSAKGPTSNTNWGVNPDMLEKATDVK